MKKKLVVSLLEYLKDLGYSGKRLNKAVANLTASGIVDNHGGEDVILVHKYGEFLLKNLRESRDKALNSNSTDDLFVYCNLIIDSLSGWIKMFRFISAIASDVKGTSLLKGFKAAYKETFVVLDEMVDHLKDYPDTTIRMEK